MSAKHSCEGVGCVKASTTCPLGPLTAWYCSKGLKTHCRTSLTGESWTPRWRQTTSVHLNSTEPWRGAVECRERGLTQSRRPHVPGGKSICVTGEVLRPGRILASYSGVESVNPTRQNNCHTAREQMAYSVCVCYVHTACFQHCRTMRSA